MVYNAPYRATQADLDAYMLEADRIALQEIIDAQLNASVVQESLLGSQTGLAFECVDPWVVIIYARFPSMTSVAESDAGQGFLSVFELSLWIPIIKRQTVAGALLSELGWFMPLVYTAPTASVLTGREIYGYPKVPAFLRAPQLGPPVAVQARHALAGDPSNPPVEEDVFCAPSTDPAEFDPPLLKEPLLAAAIGRYVANHPVVFRKQAGLLQLSGARPQMSYNAIIESRVPITRLGDIRWARCTQPFTNIPRTVAKQLRLKSDRPTFRISIRDCTLDVQQGREIWVSKQASPYIPPFEAFDGEPRPTLTTFGIGPKNPAAPPSSEGGPLLGVGEAYFARTRRGAIAALLAEHFPRHVSKWLPTADCSRDFVMLLLLRAKDDAATRLCEFGVWVPVKYRGQDAWYLPYLFRSPGAAVVQAREWLGHPCQESHIKYDDADAERSVEFQLRVVTGEGRVEWRRAAGITLSLTLSRPAESAEEWREKLPNEKLSVVGLRQVRHAADTTRACLQHVNTYELDLHAQVAATPVFRRLELASQLRLGRILDLDGERGVLPGWRLEALTMSTTESQLRGQVDARC